MEKIINLNPVFINKEHNFDTDLKLNIFYFLVIFEIILILILLYTFFYDEIFFIIESFKPRKKQYDSEFINKIESLKSYIPSCNNNILEFSNQTETIQAKYFDGTDIVFSNNQECKEFIDSIN